MSTVASGIRVTDSAETVQLTLVALAGVALLLFLIVRRKTPPFAALLLVSLSIGLAAGWPQPDPVKVLAAMQQGMASTLGFVAIVVGLGAMFGGMLQESGAAVVLARGWLRRVDARRAPWALAMTGFMVSVPVFFDVAFVVLVPLLVGLARRAGAPVMSFALPLLAGMVVTHSFVPPTPGPIGVASILGADLGLVIAYGVLVGLPCTVVAGPLLVRWLGRSLPARHVAGPDPSEPGPGAANPPSLRLVVGLILLPIVLIVASTLSLAWTGAAVEAAGWARALRLLGHPFVALLITTLLCFWLLGTRRGMPRERVSEVATRALEPAGIIILVTGAGGVLKQVMIDTNVGTVLAAQLVSTGISPLPLAFLVAWVIRVMQGSATVAMLTGASLVLPLLEPTGLTPSHKALVVISIAAGATCTSHVNDSGFWLVSRYLGLSVPETLRSWTLMNTVVGLVGLGVAWLLSLLVS